MTNMHTFARLRRSLAPLLGLMLSIGAAHAADTVTYYHTDALGTPVMESNAVGLVTYAQERKPYGERALGAAKDGPGFTGHIEDMEAGLIYMQARYYDSVASRFLSRDPVSADLNTGANYNRYWYANNSPYRYYDPDGRMPQGPARPSTNCGNQSCPEAKDIPPPPKGCGIMRACWFDGNKWHTSSGASGSWGRGASGSWERKAPQEGVESLCIECDVLPMLKLLKLATLGNIVLRLGTRTELEVSAHALRRFSEAEAKALAEAIGRRMSTRGAPAAGETIQETILVGGKEYSYRAFGLPGGRVSVGTAVEGKFARNVAEPNP